MPNWETIVTKFFAVSDPDGDYDHHAPSGAPADEIETLESKLGISFPSEFHDFYRHFNGIGLVDRQEPDHIPLFLRPIDEIHDYMEQCRSRFKETHPDEARRYFPFVDWWNGDSSGYWFNRDGQIEPYICTFYHELYVYEEGQDVGDFIKPHAQSIADLLTPAQETTN
jgi:hypothetical protein